MKREDCWMTFTEALEQYLTSRDRLADAQARRNKHDIEMAEYNLNEAKEHLDALTGNES